MTARGSLAGARIVCFAVCALTPVEGAAEPQHSNMAEPIFGDTVTDIDGDAAGEVEVDVRSVVPRSRGVAWPIGLLGIEGRPTRRLGFELEGGIAGAVDHGGRGDLTLRAAYAVWHGVQHDVHLQIEAGASYDRSFGSAPMGTLPTTDDGAPFRLGARVGYRYHRLTLRAGAGAAMSTGGSAPVWADAAVYGEFGPRRGDTSFVGVEAATDWTSSTPVLVAPELGLAFHEGEAHVAFGVPIYLGNHTTSAYAGGFVTLIIEFGAD